MCTKMTILLWLAAMAACSGGDTINIGDKEYTKTVLINDGATTHIVVNNGHILYRNSGLHVVKLDTLESIKVHGLGDVTVQDIAVDGAGAVWLASEDDGLYMMKSVYSNATYVWGKGKYLDLWCVVVDSTNTVYVADYISEDVYVVRDNALHKVPGITAMGIAISNDGDIYYITGTSRSFVYKKKGLQETEVTEITMPESFKTWTVKLDKKTDILYILSYDDHLFYVPPGGTSALQIKGLNDTKAIGTDDQGNIYVGTSNDIYRLTPVPIVTKNVV